MEKISLHFISPKVLNELSHSQMIEAKPWFYNTSEEILELDTNDWMIRCGEKQGKINLWAVNQTTYCMCLQSEVTEEDANFEALNYTFAVSMIGQIGNRKLLLGYLESLKQLYLNTPENNKNQTKNFEDNE